MRCNKCHRSMRGTTAYDGACACSGLIETTPTPPQAKPMDRDTCNLYLAALLTSFKPNQGIPETILLLAIQRAGGSTDDYATIRRILVESQLIHITPDHLATLTGPGMATAELVNRALAKQKKNPPCYP